MNMRTHCTVVVLFFYLGVLFEVNYSCMASETAGPFFITNIIALAHTPEADPTVGGSG